jgi:UDP-N-acetylmuramoyl-tripeptide--D-alanyl-D-alanine ligase
MRLALSDVRAAVGARWSGEPVDGAAVGVSIDSRTTVAGELFVAIQGPRCDGHDYLAQAADRGAVAAVVSRAVEGTFPLLVVEDTTRALADLARHVRRGFKAPVVAITGSTGKTTTKEFTAGLLSALGPVLKTEGNLNNQFGLPLTLSRLEPVHRAAVLELGMSAPGELRSLTGIALPDVAVITNVAPVHLEFFPSLEAIAAAKAEILEGLDRRGVAVLNHDDPQLRVLGERCGQRVIWFGSSSDDCDVSAAIKRSTLEGSAFDLLARGQAIPIELVVPGRHAIENFMAAAAVALELEVDPADLRDLAARLAPVAHRGEVLRLGDGTLLLDDCYNANPKAVVAAAATLGGVAGRRRVAFLGDMLELGERSVDLHHETGVRIGAWVDVLVAVGSQAQGFLEGARRTVERAPVCLAFDDARAAAAAVAEVVRSGDAVLVKGSRGVGLEVVVRQLEQVAKDRGRPEGARARQEA